MLTKGYGNLGSKGDGYKVPSCGCLGNDREGGIVKSSGREGLGVHAALSVRGFV